MCIVLSIFLYIMYSKKNKLTFVLNMYKINAIYTIGKGVPIFRTFLQN